MLVPAVARLQGVSLETSEAEPQTTSKLLIKINIIQILIYKLHLGAFPRRTQHSLVKYSLVCLCNLKILHSVMAWFPPRSAAVDRHGGLWHVALGLWMVTLSYYDGWYHGRRKL